MYKSKYHDFRNRFWGGVLPLCIYSTTTGRVKMVRLECIRGGSEQCIRAPLSVLLLISCPSDGYSHTPEGRTVL